jgi:hypothetical protein
MKKSLSSIMIALAFAGAAADSSAKGPAANRNEAATARYLATLVAGHDPQLAELTMFFSQMPKGGDLHHHYSGSLYAEQYVDFIDRQGFCVNKQSYRIVTDKAVIDAERALAPAQRTCLNSSETVADDFTYRELLQRWSSKDFYNHGAIQPPPDRQFFQTFGFFGPVSNANFAEGLQTLKARAIAENVSYIETMFKMSPFSVSAEFDARAWQLGQDDAAFTALMRAQLAVLDQDAAFNGNIADYVAKIIGRRRHRRRTFHDALPGLCAAPAGAVAGVLVDGGRLQGRQPESVDCRRQHRRPGKHGRVDARLCPAHEDVPVPQVAVPGRQGRAACGRAGAGRRPAGRAAIPYRSGRQHRRRRPHRPWPRPGP